MKNQKLHGIFVFQCKLRLHLLITIICYNYRQLYIELTLPVKYLLSQNLTSRMYSLCNFSLGKDIEQCIMEYALQVSSQVRVKTILWNKQSLHTHLKTQCEIQLAYHIVTCLHITMKVRLASIFIIITISNLHGRNWLKLLITLYN
ncbi:hypothetical protein SS50377_22655 [Spironucleus salmonicida]|uniref:Uncharacterized protein n=1 Tax=Spironucleus salmonicida TaxID=348837 RepID=A0A9P8LVD6_9EUKA|nr:hypothetical protein SS50377_22655 [Spironucleus salmonicida]